MNIKPLKFVLLVENIICVHRNRTKHGSVIRLLINFQIFCVLFLTAANSIFTLDISNFKVNALYFYGNIVSSTVIILLACYHSKDFDVLLEYLTTNHTYVKDDREYLKNLARNNKITISATTGFFVNLLCLILYTINFNRLHDFVVPDKERLITYLFYANTMTCSFRYIFEYIVIYSILEVLSEQLKCVTRYVDNVAVAGRETGSAIGNYQEKFKELDKWCKTYANVKESSKNINVIFGLQLTFMIATVVFYFIVFLYSLIALGVAGRLPTSSLCYSIISMIVNLIPLTMVSRAAQHTQNTADVLRQRLGSLLINSLWNADFYKATKDLLRFVSTRPIRTQAFGSICVDMSLLPACVLFFTYYTVIALQFNNVL